MVVQAMQARIRVSRLDRQRRAVLALVSVFDTCVNGAEDSHCQCVVPARIPIEIRRRVMTSSIDLPLVPALNGRCVRKRLRLHRYGTIA